MPQATPAPLSDSVVAPARTLPQGGLAFEAEIDSAEDDSSFYDLTDQMDGSALGEVLGETSIVHSPNSLLDASLNELLLIREQDPYFSSVDAETRRQLKERLEVLLEELTDLP